MKAIRIRITDLLEEHGDTFQKCKGCATCEEIKTLRKQLERDPAEKFKRILAKGQDMTRSEMEMLIENEVQRKQIKKALGMHWNQFCEMMQNLKLDKRSEMEMAKLEMTVDEFVKLKYINKLSIVAIAKLKGVADPTIHHWMKQRQIQINLAVQKLNLQHKNVADTKPTKEDKTAEYGALIAELKIKLTDAESRISEKDNLIRNLGLKVAEYENISAACDDVESEISSLREEKEKLYKDKVHNDYIVENQKYQFGQYAKQNEELQEENTALKVLARRYLA